MDSLFYFGQDKGKQTSECLSSKILRCPSFQVCPGDPKVNKSDKDHCITIGLCRDFTTLVS